VAGLSSTPPCPFCDGARVELVGHWGGQIITAQWRCLSCGTYYEAVRADFDSADGLVAERPFERPPSTAVGSDAGPQTSPSSVPK
jgi:hypothetical protein